VSLAAGRVGYALGSPRGWLRIFWARLERRRYRLWARRAARAAAELHHVRTYAAVVVSTPPHWSQAAGAWMKASAGIPFVADLRDPWAATAFLPESVASGEWLRLARRDERSTVAAADLVLANTEAAADWLRGAHPRHAARIAVVRNGWDDDPPRTPERRRFRIVYAGSIYGDRSPEPIFRAIASLRRRRTIGPDDLRVEVMGKIDPGEAWLRRLADAHGLADVLRVEPPGPRADADALMARAAVLVSLPWSQDLAVPAKVYEFMRFEAWPLVLAGPDSAPARLLEGTGAIVADPSAPDHIAAVLESLFDRWRAGDRPGIPAGRESLSRRSAVRDLVAHLDGLPARRRGEPAVAS
jgi:glycosyltransferase involved in cell wall biosynthesis